MNMYKNHKLRVHDRRFVCSICLRGFSHRSYLNDHLERCNKNLATKRKSTTRSNCQLYDTVSDTFSGQHLNHDNFIDKPEDNDVNYNNSDDNDDYSEGKSDVSQESHDDINADNDSFWEVSKVKLLDQVERDKSKGGQKLRRCQLCPLDNPVMKLKMYKNHKLRVHDRRFVCSICQRGFSHIALTVCLSNSEWCFKRE